MSKQVAVEITLPDDIACAVYELRKNKHFAGCSDSEIIERLISAGLEADMKP